ncbi:MAG: hypothetical protein EOR16_35690 [Mesorhizobium sp.]|uniref:zeta toxin family protein n=1 Tax=Mesorhizobium sp. TaxID=1871066 RepID=UPI000FEA7061|nr:zeta toxin family protein [Mesorhizobium sp.]RWI46365.1 MAG: hypothetical protein EOR16_35690 [Mesorhizobium sp.]
MNVNVDDIFNDIGSNGQMDPATARQIFNDKIVPLICAKEWGPTHPTFIMVAGQQGSGKSTTIRQAKLGLREEQTQIVISDDCDTFVPGYYDRALEEPMDAARYAGSAGSDYFVQATIARAKRMGQNLVIEQALAVGSAFSAHRYKDLGYRTELHIVATPHYQSWTGVFDRAERALRTQGHIGTNVLVPRDAHDECYAGWARAVFDAEQQKQYDRVVIARRDGTIMYDNQLVRQGNGTIDWHYPPKGLEVLLLERHRPVTETDASEAYKTWKRIVESPHMNACLGREHLKSYASEITGFVNSQASRVDLNAKGPVRFGANELTRWSMNIVKDLDLAVSSRNQFGVSLEFERRTHQYSKTLHAVANEYHWDSLAMETSQKRRRRLTRLQDFVRSSRLQDFVKDTFRSGANYDKRQVGREASGRGS